MLFSENYFNRYPSFPAFYPQKPSEKLAIIVVIPCYDDEHVFETLQSLENANRISSGIELIVVVNSARETDEIIVKKNRDIFEKLKQKSAQKCFSNFDLLPILIEDIPRKKRGVGFARKTGMDEAVRRFSLINKPEGLIVSLDADALVAKSYFQIIEAQKYVNNKIGAFSFQFQHDFDEKKHSREIIEACVLYETYLRYFRLALKYAGFPFAFHTIGSCFAVSANTYVKSGGMPSKQGGEDFYFLHKLAKMTEVKQLSELMVFPSPRMSDRVPFGTGPSVKKIIEQGEYEVYNFQLFSILKSFFACFNTLFYSKKLNLIDEEIVNFVGKEKIFAIIDECRQNCASESSFVKRMFSIFDAFFVVKFLNSFDAESKFPPQEINKSARELFQALKLKIDENNIYETIKKLDLTDSL